jgi:hypothetical protein
MPVVAARPQVGGNGPGGRGRDEDQVERQVRHPHLRDLGAAQALREHPDERMVTDIAECLAAAAAGHREKVFEEVPQIALLGISAASAMGGIVVAEEAIQDRRIAGSEISVDLLFSYPRFERTGRFREGEYRLLVEWPLLVVDGGKTVLRPRPLKGCFR